MHLLNAIAVNLVLGLTTLSTLVKADCYPGIDWTVSLIRDDEAVFYAPILRDGQEHRLVVCRQADPKTDCILCGNIYPINRIVFPNRMGLCIVWFDYSSGAKTKRREFMLEGSAGSNENGTMGTEPDVAPWGSDRFITYVPAGATIDRIKCS